MEIERNLSILCLEAHGRVLFFCESASRDSSLTGALVGSTSEGGMLPMGTFRLVPAAPGD